VGADDGPVQLQMKTIEEVMAFLIERGIDPRRVAPPVELMRGASGLPSAKAPRVGHRSGGAAARSLCGGPSGNANLATRFFAAGPPGPDDSASRAEVAAKEGRNRYEPKLHDTAC
jgi:hypothetical protein